MKKYTAFGDYGGLIFPVNSGYYSGDTLGELSLTWYDIYSDEEKAAGPDKKIFFKGDPGARFAICNAGGGFAYVGAMHDSFHMHWNCLKRAITLSH